MIYIDDRVVSRQIRADRKRADLRLLTIGANGWHYFRMTRHNLKCHPEYFHAMAVGAKTFDVRRDDRGYRVGDQVQMEEYDLDNGPTGRVLLRKITYVLRHFAPVHHDFVVLSLAEV